MNTESIHREVDCVKQTRSEAAQELAKLPGVTKEWIARRVAALPEEHADLPVRG
jgi:hypothetical protein